MSTTRLVFAAPGDGAWSQVAASGTGKRDSVVLVLPGEDILGREAAIPGSTQRQAQAAALQVLADDLAAAEGNIAAVGAPAPGAAGAARLGCVIARTRLSDWQAAARARGLRPDRIVPDYCLLARPGQVDVLRVAHAGGRVIARGTDGGFASEDGLLALLACGRHVEPADLEQEAVSAVRSGRLASEPDFSAAIPPETPAGHDARLRTRILVAASLAAALFLAAPWVQVLRLNLAAGQARQAAEDTARSSLPGASRIVNARAQIAEALIPLGGANGSLAAAQALLAGLRHAPTVQITSLASEGEEALAQLSAAQDGDLQPLRDHLAASEVAVTETASPGPDGRLVVDLRLRAAR